MGTSDRKIDRAMEGKRLTLTGVFKAQSDLFRLFVRSSIVRLYVSMYVYVCQYACQLFVRQLIFNYNCFGYGC